MKKIKYFIAILAVFFALPFLVNAGEIRFNTPLKTSENTYEFTLTIDSIPLNYVSGDIKVSNGTITNIKMESSWINKTENNNRFYFYHNGRMSGSYTIATIEVTMTGNSEYSIHNLDYGLNKCTIDSYGNYFGENGSIVSKMIYDSTCSINKDASLKSLTMNYGTLSPNFDSSLELYNVTVENAIDIIKFNPIPKNEKAKVISGTTCSLKVGINICKIIVQAEAGNTKTYSITVTRKNENHNTLSSDASISNLEVHGGTLTKSFQPNTKEYEVKIDKNAKSLYFTFTTNSDNTKHTSKSCSVTEDTKTCKLTITAEDGTKNSYVFTLIHENSSNQNVSDNNSSTNNNSNHANTTNKNDSSSNTKQENSSSNEKTPSTTTDTISNNGNQNTNVDNNSEKEDNNSIENSENNDVNNSEQEEKIKLPLIKKEVNKDIFFKVIALVDLLLGIFIGVFVMKIYKKRVRNK